MIFCITQWHNPVLSNLTLLRLHFTTTLTSAGMAESCFFTYCFIGGNCFILSVLCEVLNVTNEHGAYVSCNQYNVKSMRFHINILCRTYFAKTNFLKVPVLANSTFSIDTACEASLDICLFASRTINAWKIGLRNWIIAQSHHTKTVRDAVSQSNAHAQKMYISVRSCVMVTWWGVNLCRSLQ